MVLPLAWPTQPLGYPSSPQRAGRWSPWTPEKKQMNNPFYYSLTRRWRVQVLPTRARNNDTWDRRRIVNNMRRSPTFSATCGPQTCGCRGSGPTVRIGRVLHTSLSRVHARTPTYSPPDVKTGRGTPRSLYTLLHLCMSLLCLLRVLLFALGRVIT
jgi:hypothetical protein